MSGENSSTGGVRERMEGSTRVLTIDNGERNLLNPAMMHELRSKLLEADSDTAVLAVLLTGARDCFCGGLDIAAIQAGADPVEFASALVELLRVMPMLGVPLAAAVNGDALASGASIVAACDYAAAVSTALIGTMEVSVGIWPMIAQVPLIHRLGPRLAIENVGSGEPFSAEKSKELGLVQRIVRRGEEVAATEEWLDKASRAPRATPAGRRSLYEFASLPYAEALDASLARFVAQFE